MRKGLILFAHGSPDPQWHHHIESIRKIIEGNTNDLRVACAYINFTKPNLHEAAAALIKEGVSHLTIIPIFLGIGQHLQKDLPMLLSQLAHDQPDIKIKCSKPIGENERVLQLLANIAVSETD